VIIFIWIQKPTMNDLLNVSGKMIKFMELKSGPHPPHHKA